MRFDRLAAGDPRMAEVFEIYEDAFFENERLSNVRVEEMVRMGTTALTASIEENRVTGFALTHRFPELDAAWLDYFAVRKDRRGRGLGSLLLSDGVLGGLEESRLFLEVGDDEGENGAFGNGWERRVRFYLSLGAGILQGVPYLFPAVSGPIPMSLMAFSPKKALALADARSIVARAYRVIHGIDEEHPLLSRSLHGSGDPILLGSDLERERARREIPSENA